MVDGDPGPLALGFDIGGTNIRAIPVARTGPVGEWAHVRRPDRPDLMLDAIVRLWRQAAERYDIAAIGLGCAGVVDRAGVVRTSPNIAMLNHYPLRELVAAATGLAVAVDNDATAAAWAEASVPGHWADDLALVTFGTGIGGGFVLDGRLYRGASGFAGEIGHMTVVAGGILCVCGRRGCWERYASGSALGHQARDAVAAGRAPTVLAAAGGEAQAVRGEHVLRLAAEGDPVAEGLVAEHARWIALGLDSLANLLDPSVFVLGGGVSEAGETFRAAVEAAYRAAVVDREARSPAEIRLSYYGDRAGAVGAGLIALDRLAEGD